MQLITTPILIKCGADPTFASRYVEALNYYLPRYGITTLLRAAHFLSQILHESIRLTATVENMNYGVDALMRTWPKRFPTSQSALPYAHQPQKLANYVYANRLGNGPAESNDGWNYRGHGPGQLTGKDKYIDLTKKSAKVGQNVDYLAHPEYLSRPMDGVWSFCEYWKDNGINAKADTDNPVLVRKAVNGGIIGLDETEALLIKCKAALAPLFA